MDNNNKKLQSNTSSDQTAQPEAVAILPANNQDDDIVDLDNTNSPRVSTSGQNSGDQPLLNSIIKISAKMGQLEKDLSDTQAGLDKETKDIERDQKKIIGVLRVTRKDMSNMRDRTMESLTIFVALLTFISTGFSIVKQASGILMSSLLIVISGIMVAFSGIIILINSLSSDDKYRQIISISITAAGIIMALIAGIIIAICS